MALQQIRTVVFVVMLTSLAAMSSGCASKYTDLKAFVQSHDHGDVGTSTYRIEAPDVIRISSPTSPEVDGVTDRIGIDGKVSLKLIGDVKVSRLTSREAATKIEELLTKYYRDPKVHVEVVDHKSKKIYLHGQVAAQGSISYTGRDTLVDVLSRAKMTELAWGAQVRVIRPSADPGARHELVVNVDRMLETGDLRENVLLQPGDIVYVPPTPLAWVGLRCRELLYPVSPVLNTYQAPANFMDAQDEYDRHFDDDE